MVKSWSAQQRSAGAKNKNQLARPVPASSQPLKKSCGKRTVPETGLHGMSFEPTLLDVAALLAQELSQILRADARRATWCLKEPHRAFEQPVRLGDQFRQATLLARNVNKIRSSAFSHSGTPTSLFLLTLFLMFSSTVDYSSNYTGLCSLLVQRLCELEQVPRARKEPSPLPLQTEFWKDENYDGRGMPLSPVTSWPTQV